MKTLILKSYPDGTATVTKKRQSVRVADRRSCRWDERSAARRGAMAVLGGQQLANLLGIELGESAASPFPCQEIQKSVKPSKPLRMGLTDRGRKVLRRTFAAWETQLSPGTCAFGTLTLSDDAMRALMWQDKSPPHIAFQQAVSRFMERLRKLLCDRGLPGDVIWVTELHPKRSARMGICIPHVHFVCQTAHIKYQWEVKPSEIKDLWTSALNSQINNAEGKRFPSRCEIKCVKKSVARYVSKYLSKTQRCEIQNDPNLITLMVPERWYAVANALHKLCKKMTSVITGEEACLIFDWLKRPECPVVKRTGDITLPDESGRPIWLATWFIFHCRLDSDGLRLLALSPH